MTTVSAMPSLLDQSCLSEVPRFHAIPGHGVGAGERVENAHTSHVLFDPIVRVVPVTTFLTRSLPMCCCTQRKRASIKYTSAYFPVQGDFSHVPDENVR